MQVLLLIGYFSMQCGEYAKAACLTEKLMGYIRKRITDEDALVGIFPQCAWLLALIYEKQGEREQAYEVCEEGIKLLKKKGGVTVLKELLKIQQRCLDTKLEEGKVQYLQRQIEAITFLHRAAEYQEDVKPVFWCLRTERRCEVVLVHELLRDLRMARGMSQAELGWGICTQETLSRIEMGRKPNKKNLRELLAKLGSERETYYGYIVADDYRLYEKAAEFKRYQCMRDQEHADEIIQELERELDMTIPVNRQFVEISHVEARIAEGALKPIEAVRELEKILRYTMKLYQGAFYRVPYRQEFIVLNMMAFFMKQAGMQEDAVILYEKILEQYQKSSVDEKDHMLSEMLLYCNYAIELEISGRLEEAETTAKRGIHLFVHCERGDLTSLMLANLACVYEKQGQDAMYEVCVRHGYYLLEMYGRTQTCEVMKKAYLEKYGKKLGVDA